MIRCRLLEMMGRHGIRFMSRLSDQTGINRRTLAVLAENKMARYDSDVLERLCAFFACQPGDLLEYTDGEGATLSHLEGDRRKAVRPDRDARP